MNEGLTLGVSTKGNIRALTMCLSSALTGRVVPSHIQLRLEGDLPGFNDFYLEQIIALAKLHEIPVQLGIFQSTGVRDSRDWQIQNCSTPHLWMVDDDVIFDCDCLFMFIQVMKASPGYSYYAGSKPDVNNRRKYPFFDTKVQSEEDFEEGANQNLFWDIDSLQGRFVGTRAMDTGNVVLDVPQIRKANVKFRLFPDQANPSGDGTTFSMSLDKAGLKGVFVPAARAYHLEKPGEGFSEFAARAEMLYRTADICGFDKTILRDYFMPDSLLVKPQT